MDFSSYFPIWNKLTPTQQQILERNAVLRKVDKGTVIHNGTVECTGLLLVRSGQLRAYILSDEGREISLYRLFDRDICLFSASCMMNSIQFEITIEAQKDTTMWVISADTYQRIMKESAVVANFTNEIMATRFSEVMWLMEQIMWKSFDKRLAEFLLEECSLEETNILKITHETIAGHMGTAREVVTRMLRYFQNEGMVRLTRGTGLSQILCNHREVVKNRVKILKGGSGISCCRLVYKITAVNGHVKGGGVSLHSS